jgi:hypothetical protein
LGREGLLPSTSPLIPGVRERGTKASEPEKPLQIGSDGRKNNVFWFGLHRDEILHVLKRGGTNLGIITVSWEKQNLMSGIGRLNPRKTKDIFLLMRCKHV